MNIEVTQEIANKNPIGIKIPGTIDELVHTVDYDATTVELQVVGIPNATIKLPVLGKSDSVEFVFKEEKNIKPEGEVRATETVSQGTPSAVPASSEHTNEPHSDSHEESGHVERSGDDHSGRLPE